MQIRYPEAKLKVRIPGLLDELKNLEAELKTLIAKPPRCVLNDGYKQYQKALAACKGKEDKAVAEAFKAMARDGMNDKWVNTAAVLLKKQKEAALATGTPEGKKVGAELGKFLDAFMKFV